ncbi:hypothetical protein Misp06_04325 [Microbulbifer sp. NBRC 101763]|uniref:hypothetical protein n=1 Tax=Microbulbifer sp. NBRC 101763 TaxID=1113820 RepID=UPI0030A1D443
MSWFIDGNCEKLQIGILESGNLSIWGDASAHDVKPVGGDIDHEFYEKLRKADCSWSIHPSNEDELHLDGMGTGFYKKIQENPDKSIAAINFHDPDLIGITITLAPETFQAAKDLFEHVLTRPELSYMITLGFRGFRVPEAKTDTPSIKEFQAGSLEGKVYISEEVSFLIKRVTRNS